MFGKKPQQFSADEFKPEPCVCGANQYERVEAFMFMIHRIDAKTRMVVALEKFVCQKCQRVRDPKTGESSRPSLVDP